MASKLCDSCKSSTATLFCRADSAFICVGCDSKVHAANKLASRHARVWVCEVCEQAPAHVICKADAAALCVTCDLDIHAANPLARRHERVPVTPFFEPINFFPAKPFGAVLNFLDDGYMNNVERDADGRSEEAEAASWLLSDPKAVENPGLSSGQYLFSEMDPYLDLDYGPVDPKVEAQEQSSSGTDSVVPVQNKNPMVPSSMIDHCFDIDFSCSKSLSYSYTAHCLNHSLSSSSSLDVGVVPDGNTMSDESICYCQPIGTVAETANQVVQLSAADREARVLRYREKRKNRKFEKTIRYASRKAYAEARPRIKGRFAKRSEVEVDLDHFGGYGVVPTF